MVNLDTEEEDQLPATMHHIQPPTLFVAASLDVVCLHKARMLPFLKNLTVQSDETGHLSTAGGKLAKVTRPRKISLMMRMRTQA